jgi:hypothetical protein
MSDDYVFPVCTPNQQEDARRSSVLSGLRGKTDQLPAEILVLILVRLNINY